MSPKHAKEISRVLGWKKDKLTEFVVNHRRVNRKQDDYQLNQDVSSLKRGEFAIAPDDSLVFRMDEDISKIRAIRAALKETEVLNGRALKSDFAKKDKSTDLDPDDLEP